MMEIDCHQHHHRSCLPETTSALSSLKFVLRFLLVDLAYLYKFFRYLSRESLAKLAFSEFLFGVSQIGPGGMLAVLKYIQALLKLKSIAIANARCFNFIC